jgi:hypothetical protein
MALQELYSLTTICPFWTGKVIKSAFDAMILGIDKENERLGSSRYLTIERTVELDEDGFCRSLQLLTGFDDEESAVASIENLSKESMKKALSDNWSSTYVWRQEAKFQKPYPNMQGPKIICIKAVNTHASDGSCYHEKWWQYEVLRVETSPTVGPDLFSCFADNDYYDVSSQWQKYLISRGSPNYWSAFKPGD